LSKCDLLDGFQSFKKVLLDGIEEENKILGSCSFDEFDTLANEMQQWQAAKALRGCDISDSWLFIQNITALKERVWIYDQILADFTKSSHRANISLNRHVPFFRGYFFSSCRQYFVNEDNDWEEKADAYFTRDLFQEKILKETRLGRPVKTTIDDDIEPKRRIAKIATIVVMVGILFWVLQYFGQNSSHFEKLEQYTSNFVVEEAIDCKRHEITMEKLIWYDNNVGNINTKKHTVYCFFRSY
jgi:hypothetical protein